MESDRTSSTSPLGRLGAARGEWEVGWQVRAAVAPPPARRSCCCRCRQAGTPCHASRSRRGGTSNRQSQVWYTITVEDGVVGRSIATESPRISSASFPLCYPADLRTPPPRPSPPPPAVEISTGTTSPPPHPPPHGPEQSPAASSDRPPTMDPLHRQATAPSSNAGLASCPGPVDAPHATACPTRHRPVGPARRGAGEAGAAAGQPAGRRLPPPWLATPASIPTPARIF